MKPLVPVLSTLLHLAIPSIALEAEKLPEKADLSGGLCVLIDPADPALAVQWAQHPRFLVHVVQPDPKQRQVLQSAAAEAGVLGRNLTVSPADRATLPFPDHLVDLIQMPEEGVFPESEILRVLAPERGRALLGDRVLTKPALEGSDDWTHRLHSASNNPVAGDTAFAGETFLQYLAMPMQTSFQGTMLVANGRRIELSDWVTKKPDRTDVAGILRARSAANGQPLWERPLPEGIEPDMPICALHEDRIYLAAAEGCGVIVIDAETGRDLEPIELSSDPDRRVNWIGIDGNRLHALIGHPMEVREKLEFAGGKNRKSREKQYQAGDTVVGWDLQSGVETFRHDEGTTIDYRTIATRDGRTYFYAEEKRLVCLDPSGRLAWENDEADWLETVRRPLLLRNINTEAVSTLIVGGGHLRFAVPGGKKEYLFDAEDGTYLWQRDWARLSPKSLFLDNQYITPQGAFDASTGNENEAFDVSILGAGCGIVTWVPGLEGGLGHVAMGVKSPCGVGAYAAGGMLSFAPSQCDCWPHLRGAAGFGSGGQLFEQVRSGPEHPLIRGQEPEIRDQRGGGDWPTYRGTLRRNGSANFAAGETARVRWISPLAQPLEVPEGHGRHRDRWLERPTPPVTAGDLAFQASSDGSIRAVRRADGGTSWVFWTGGAVLTSPTIDSGRLYAGSGDGWVYCLAADSGELIWKWRGAPIDRRVVMYGKLTSLWPVTSVVVSGGTVYGVAGQHMQNGSVTFALDAATGEANWTTWTEPAHESRTVTEREDFGFGPAGQMTVLGKRLIIRTMLGMPAIFDTGTGARIPPSEEYRKLCANNWSMGFRTATAGQDLVVLDENTLLQGGYPLLGNPDIRHDKAAAKYLGWRIADDGALPLEPLPWWAIPHSQIAPALDGDSIALAGGIGRSGRSDNPTIGLSLWSLAGWEAELNRVPESENKDPNAGDPNAAPTRASREALNSEIKRFKTSLDMEQAEWRIDKADVSALALAKDCVVAVLGEREWRGRQATPFTGWKLSAFARENGDEIWSVDLPGEPVFNGIAATGEGHWILGLRDGSLVAVESEN